MKHLNLSDINSMFEHSKYVGELGERHKFENLECVYVFEHIQYTGMLNTSHLWFIFNHDGNCVAWRTIQKYADKVHVGDVVDFTAQVIGHMTNEVDVLKSIPKTVIKRPTKMQVKRQ